MQSDYGFPGRTRGDVGRGGLSFISRGGFTDGPGFGSGANTTSLGGSGFGDPPTRGFGRGSSFGLSGRGSYGNNNDDTPPASGFGSRGRGGGGGFGSDEGTGRGGSLGFSDAPTRGFAGRGRGGFSTVSEEPPVRGFGGHGGDTNPAPIRGFSGRGRAFDAEEESARGFGGRGGTDIAETPMRGFGGRGRGADISDVPTRGFSSRGRGDSDDADGGGFRGRGRGGFRGGDDEGGFRERGRGGFRGGDDEGGFRGRGRGGFQSDSGEEFTSGFRGRGRGGDDEGGFRGRSGFGESRTDFGGNRSRFDNAGEGTDSYQRSRPAFGGEDEFGAPPKPTDPNEIVNEETPRGYAPTKRNVDALFKEDADNAKDYAGVFDADDDIIVENLKEHVLSSIERWDEMELNANLLRNVKDKSMYLRPRKIQSFVIPFIIDGYDVKGQAETGSGKTAAFVIPVIQRILEMKSEGLGSDMMSPFCVVVCPTRELVLQVYEQASKFSDGLDVSVAKSYGQYAMGLNVREMQTGCDIFVTTPGRLRHFATEGTLRLKQMMFFILDEADRMMGDNFMSAIDEVMSLPGFPEPEKRQTLLFSATFDGDVEDVCKRLLRPGFVFVTNKRNNPNKRIAQSFVVTDAQDKLSKCLEILKSDPDKKTLVFVGRKSTADILACFLCRNEVKTTSIHGDRGQHQRERALSDFRNGFCKVLVATDVAARGLDISGLDHVINYDMPNEGTTYVHRIGRTGRIRQGRATSIVTTQDASMLSNIAEELRNSGSPVPDSLKEAVEKLGGGGFSYGGGGGSRMAASGGNATTLTPINNDDW